MLHREMKNMSMAELLIEYNALSGKAVVKFKDRKTAEKRVQNARVIYSGTSKVSTTAKKVVAKKPVKKVVAKKPVKKVVAKKPVKKTVKTKKPSNKAQWTRNKVMVTKGNAKPKEYNSTSAAFKALGLPMGKRIRFRMKLKAVGSLEINGYKFKLVK